MKPFEIKLIFNSKKDAKTFVAYWLDGGGEQNAGCLTNYEESDDWVKHIPRYLKLEDFEVRK